MTDLLPYYRRRAQEYEQIWHRDDPVRQGEQSAMAAALQDLFRHRRVLEVACGTGYWTQFAAVTAARVCAIDGAPETLDVARAKNLPADQVTFRAGDAYALAGVPGDFDAALAMCWFSHVPIARHAEFLAGLHRRLEPGAVVFMADNMNVPGVGGELIRRDGCADTFKLRTLADGSRHEVLKNYFTAAELRQLLSPLATDLRVHAGQCFWWASYCVR
jgi:SAM-dependent methyltransferase